MLEFIAEWGTTIKAVLSFITLGGIIIGFLKKMNTIGNNLSVIPELKEKLDETADEVKLFKAEHANYEKIIKDLSNSLKEHCSKDKQKQKMILDMARQTLLNEMERAIKEEEVTVSRKAVIGELYDSYKDNGGNGTVKDLWSEFIHLPLK